MYVPVVVAHLHISGHTKMFIFQDNCPLDSKVEIRVLSNEQMQSRWHSLIAQITERENKEQSRMLQIYVEPTM